MTGKLLKYELKSSYTYMLVIWAAILVAAVLTSITGHVDSDTAIGTLITVIPILLYVAAIIALVVAMVFVIVIRFYKGLLGEEGYLMHTLPVKEWQLITSKGLAATIFTLGSMAAVIISSLVFVAASGTGIEEFMKAIGEVLKTLNFKVVIILIECLVLLILGILKSIYQVYASLAIGQLVDKHRILLAIGAYVGISVALVILASIGIQICDSVFTAEFFQNWEVNPLDSANEFLYFQLMLIFVFIVEAVQLVVFHIVTERLLTKKLNLL